MAVIKQHDKRSGITYVYESHSYWDPEKKMTRAKRKLIGKVDPVTGETVPTDARNKKSSVPSGDNTDYRKMYEKLLKKYEAQETLIGSLKKQIEELRKKNGRPPMPISPSFDTGTLRIRLKAAEEKIKAFESGEKYVRMQEQFKSALREQNERIRRLEC